MQSSASEPLRTLPSSFSLTTQGLIILGSTQRGAAGILRDDDGTLAILQVED